MPSITDMGKFSQREGRTRMSAWETRLSTPAGSIQPGISTLSERPRAAMAALVFWTSPSPARVARQLGSCESRPSASTSWGTPLYSTSLPRNRMRTWPSALQILGLGEPGVALGRITTRDESEAFCSITTLRLDRRHHDDAPGACKYASDSPVQCRAGFRPVIVITAAVQVDYIRHAAHPGESTKDNFAISASSSRKINMQNIDPSRRAEAQHRRQCAEHPIDRTEDVSLTACYQHMQAN